MTLNLTEVPPPSLDLRLEVTEVLRAIRSYTYVVKHNWSTDASKPIGSVVMIRAWDKLFALTAKHCVSDDMAIVFRTTDGERQARRIVKTSTLGNYDCAVLELEPRSDISAASIEQICLDQLMPPKPGENPESQSMVWVAGYPSRLARFRGSTCTVTEAAFGTNVVSASPDLLSLYYHKSGFGIDSETLECGMSDLPATPHGFSGGGVWGLLRPTEGVFYNPLRYIRLFGIQYEWGDISRILKCVPSRVIFAILHKHYREFGERLDSLFPAGRSLVSDLL